MKRMLLFGKTWLSLILAGVLLLSAFPAAAASVADAAEETVPSFLDCTWEQKASFVRRLPEYETTENMIGFETTDGMCSVFVFPVAIRHETADGSMQMYSEAELTALLCPSKARSTSLQTVYMAKDATVYSATPSTNYQSEQYTDIGNTVSHGVGRAYYQINLSAFNGRFPGEIEAAYMYFYDLNASSGGSEAVAIHKVTEDWSANTVTFNNQPAFESTASYRYYKDSYLGSRQLVVLTDLVRDWIQNGNNYGFVVKADNENGSEVRTYTRSNYTDSGKLPYMLVSYYPRSNDYWGFVNVNSSTFAKGKVFDTDNISVSFTVSEEETFFMETAQPHCPYGAQRDTKLYLYNSSGTLLAYNDNISATCSYSRLCCTLGEGDYTVRITEAGTDFDKVHDMYTFFTLWIAGELVTDSVSNPSYTTYECYTQVYANLCTNFTKVDDATPDYNCLGYAMETYVSDNFISVWNIEAMTHYFTTNGYVQVEEPTSDCVVFYGYYNSNGVGQVRHFARIVNGTVTAKLGHLELVQHTAIDSYYSSEFSQTNGDYGSPIAYFVKNS